MAKYLFFDTNIFLHYQDVEKLMLEERYGKGYILVIPRVILGELDKHKDSHKSPKIQKRARSICKKIHSWDKSGQINDNIQFKFMIKTSDPKKHGLDSDKADDRVLADILEFDAPQEDKILVAADMNMILTAKHLGIITEELDENYKLPSSQDPLEKEIHELQRKLNRLQSALPKLKVGLIKSENDCDADPNPVFQIPKPKLLSDAEIEEKVSHLKLENVMPTDVAHLSGPFGYSQEDINQYRKDIRNYPAQYKQYLHELKEHQNCCRICFQIAIINIGTAPAENIDISFHFPNGFDLYLEDGLPVPPNKPSPPQKPKTNFEKLNIDRRMDFANLRYDIPNVNLPTSYSLKRTNSYDFTDSFDLIKHNEKEKLPELFLVFPSCELVKSFQCTYRITVANLPDIVEGVINFKFEMVN